MFKFSINGILNVTTVSKKTIQLMNGPMTHQYLLRPLKKLGKK